MENKEVESAAQAADAAKDGEKKSVDNAVQLKGNLVKEPEFKTLPSGTLAARARMAASDTYMNKDGEKIEETVYVDLEAYGKAAESLKSIWEGKSEKKFLDVYGQLSQQKWEKDGKTKSKTFVTATHVELYDAAKRQEAGRPYKPNSVKVVGNLVADPEVHEFEDGGKAVTVSIAFNSKDKEGKDKEPQFFELSATGKAAAELANAKKGDFYSIKGKLKLDQWKDKATGESRSKLVVKPLEATNLARSKEKSDPDFSYER